MTPLYEDARVSRELCNGACWVAVLLTSSPTRLQSWAPTHPQEMATSEAVTTTSRIGTKDLVLFSKFNMFDGYSKRDIYDTCLERISMSYPQHIDRVKSQIVHVAGARPQASVGTHA